MNDAVGVVVRQGDCPCPGSPHAEEIVFLEPEATLAISVTSWKALSMAEATIASQYAALVDAFIPLAIRSWSFIQADPDGGGVRSVRVNRANAERLIPWDKGGYEVAERCDSLYSGRVTAPLAARLRRHLPTGQTADSTSPNPTLGDDPPTPLRPSSHPAGAGKP